MTTYKSEMIEFRAGRIILTEAEWTANTNVYPEGIIAITSDGSNAGRTKVFNGTSYWSQLAYNSGGGGGAVTSDDVTDESTLGPGTLTAALDTLAQNVSDGATAITNLAQDFQDIGGPYEVYAAIVSQAGDTSAPTAVVLPGNSVGTVVWTRFETGIYLGTLAGAFPANKTLLILSAPIAEVAEECLFAIKRVSDDVVRINVYDIAVNPIDGLFEASVLIHIYP